MEAGSIFAHAFIDLDGAARDVAREEVRARVGYVRQVEACLSLGNLRQITEVAITNIPKVPLKGEPRLITGNRCWPNRGEMIKRLTRIGESKRGALGNHDDCHLTGYSFDRDVIRGFSDALMSGESDPFRLSLAAYEAWYEACVDDYEEFYLDEGLASFCCTNNMWFRKSGEMLATTEIS